MSAVELRWNAGEAAALDAGGSPTDYHALGAFAETWAFLELFLGRCAETVGVTPLGDALDRAALCLRQVCRSGAGVRARRLNPTRLR